MAREGVTIIDEQGESNFLFYDELDSEVLPQLWKPIGGFCYRGNDFLQLKLTSPPFYLQDWLPVKGKAMLYAPPKTGKSYISVQLARCIGRGEDFIGIPTNKGRVLYIQSELGAEILQGRMKSTKQDYDNVAVGTTFSMKLDTEQGQKYLMTAMEAVAPDVLILDPYYKMLSGDENDSSDTRKVTDFLDALIGGFNCSIVIIHHPGKDISKGGRGSSVLEDWVDSYIEMKKTSKNGEPLRIKLTPKLLRHASLPPDPFEAEMNTFEFEQVDGKLTVKQEVEQFVREQDSVVMPSNILNFGIGSRKSVYEALKALEREGKVVKKKRGEYLWQLEKRKPQ